MLLDTIVKDEEQRVFFFIGGRQPRDGETREVLPYEQEEAEAKIEKLKWERKTGHMLLNFHFDPYAGGLQALVPPKGQVVRRGNIVSQKTGEIVGFEEGQNISKGMTEMRPRGAWTGEWL